MSVSQVKKRFAEFETYLSGDKESLRRLKVLKDAVNEVRVSLAAAEKREEQAHAIKDQARERADMAENERDAAKIEVQALRQQCDAQRLTIQRLLASEVDEPEEVAFPETAEVLYGPEVRAVMKQLRKTAPECPPASMRMKTIPGRMSFYNRESLASGWKHTDMWTLGASVAMLVAMEGEIVIQSRQTFANTGETPPDKLPALRHLLKWWGGNNLDLTEEKRARAGFSMVTNLRSEHDLYDDVEAGQGRRRAGTNVPIWDVE